MKTSIEAKVGMFFFAALVVAGILLEITGGLTFFETKIPYTAYFEKVSGINKGDTVRFNGVPVGKISDVGLDQAMVRVDLYVEQEGLVRETTVAQIKKSNLLGGDFLALEDSSTDSPILSPGQKIRSERTTGLNEMIEHIDEGATEFLSEATKAVREIKEQLSGAAENISEIAEKANNGNGVVATLLNDYEMATDLKNLSSSLASVSKKLESGEGALGRLIQSDEVYENVRSAMESLASATQKIDTGQGTLGQLVNNEELYTNANQLASDLRTISQKLNESEGALGKLINDQEMYDNFLATAKSIRGIASKIESGEGSLGRVIYDDELFLDVKIAAKKVEKAAEGLRDSGPISALGSVLGAFF